MVIISVCIYGLKTTLNFRCESGFLKGGSIPLYTNVRSEYLMQLSVKLIGGYDNINDLNILTDKQYNFRTKLFGHCLQVTDEIANAFGKENETTIEICLDLSYYSVLLVIVHFCIN